jgi:hypothetical protein
LGATDAYYGKPGANTLHEITESYEGAEISQVVGYSSPNAKTSTIYTMAHQLAAPQAGPIFETVYDAQGNKLNSYNGAVRAEYSVQQGSIPPLIIMTYP